MPQTTLPTPTPDELEDLIYFSRTGELESLQSLIESICTTHACPLSVIVASAIDIDEDGLGSQASLLHYPAANGNLGVVQYLLSLVTPSSSAAEPNGAGGVVDKSAPSLVNHKNVSGNTPLHWAGMNGHLDVVQALVAAGADPTIVNSVGRDAVVESEVSGKSGSQECADWLLKNCAALEHGIGGGVTEGETDEVVQEAGDEGPSSANAVQGEART